MKNEKVCINKSIAFVTAIVVLLLGVVLFANYMNSQSLGSNSRADSTTCSLASQNIDSANKCEMKIPATDTLADGSAHKSTKEYTGRRCDVTGSATSGTFVMDTSTCAPTVRCSYGNKVYMKWDSTGLVYDGTGANDCILDADDNPINYGCKYVTVSGVVTSARAAYDTTNCPKPAGACEGTCKGAGGKEYAIDSCAPEGGKKCGCVSGKTYPTWNPDTTCVAPAANCTGVCSGTNGKTYAPGTCAPEGGKKCDCANGKTFPTWNVDTSCAAPAKTCTGTCSGKAIGYCDTTSGLQCACATGKTYPTWQTVTGCTKATATCDESKYTSYTCSTGYTLGVCKADAYGTLRRCGCDPNGTKTYPTLYAVTSCP